MDLGHRMIVASGMGKKFESRWVIRHLDLRVDRSESAVILGMSGAGKSVLLKSLAQILPIDEGIAQIASARVGMLFQKNALFDSLTVQENLLFPLKENLRIIGADAKRRTHDLLEAVGLAASAHLYPDEISGGMQKRLGIARALVTEPEVLLYDEPTAGLDPVTSRSIAQLILDLKARHGTTLLTVTNDLFRAMQLGDSIYLLHEGKLIDGGSRDEFGATEHPALRQFIDGAARGPLTDAIA